MRTLNSIKNILTSVGGQFLKIILEFASRTVFIYILGKEYLGISSLFTNVLAILSITELGIGTAIVYSLYKPLVKNNQKEIASTMNFLRRAYFIVGLIIMVIGLLLLPFLPHLMKGTTDLVQIEVVFILYLIKMVSSYWFLAYKRSILQADQKGYILNTINYFIITLRTILQVISLIIFRSFIVYLIIGIFTTIILNILVSVNVNKRYPYLSKYKKEMLSSSKKRAIFKNVFGMSLYKINSAIVRSTDSIVISSFISVVAVGIYSNYLLIISALINTMKMVFSSFAASIGNLYVSGNKEKSNFIFNCLTFLSFWIYGVCSVVLWILLNPFIELWVGQEFLLSKFVLLIIVVNFLMDGYQQVSITYKDACGLFWQGKYRPVATAILNVVISVYLAPKMGIAGVLLGTIISRLLTTWWFEPWMVHKYAFDMPAKKYYINYAIFFSLTIASAYLVQLLTASFTENTWENIIIMAVISFIVPNSVFLVLFNKKDEFIYLSNTLKKVLIKNFKK